MRLLETRSLTRRFPGVLALDHVDFAADRGEVHAVIGANGAGKSTLMNVLCGALPPSAGEILLDGHSVRFASPRDAQTLGIGIVYQEFSSIAELSVADNMFLGREFKGSGHLLDRARARREAQHILDRNGIRLRADAVVGHLSVADRQLAELARALSTQGRILILDEPTAVLSLAEQAKLFEVVGRLRSGGMLILYISHRLEEVFSLADRISVMRDGKRVATRPAADLTQAEAVALMTGRAAATTGNLPHPKVFAPVMVVSGPSIPHGPLSIGRGEIVGLAGLVGSGRTRLARQIAGLVPRAGLAVDVECRPVPDNPRAALARGVVYLTEDRKRDGIFAPLSITHNATAASLPAISPAGFILHAKERRQTQKVLRSLSLVAASNEIPMGALSGGNQQKVLIARALLARPKVLVCDEPTRGVDVSAKQEIYVILRELAAGGVAIVMVSSEFNELLACCTRLAIMRDGRVSAVVDAEGLTEHDLVSMAAGVPGA